MTENSYGSAQRTEAARRGWDSVAYGWQKWAPTIELAAQVVNDRLVDMAQLEAGHKVLDIATGYGEPLMSILERVGSSGVVVATDLSPEMIALARERVAKTGMSNVSFYACNGEVLEIPETGFDAALCRWGLMLMADPDACLSRVHELLKPGGRVAMAVFSEPAKTPLLSVAGATVRRATGIGPPNPDEPNIFRLADSADLERRFHSAGFREIALEQVASECVHDSPDAYVRFLQDVAQDIVRLTEGQSPEQQQDTWQAVVEAVQPYQAADGRVHLGLECHCITARKPHDPEIAW
ncbi:hypothetical protein L861_07865 [Litchfieldella anticariensis FP35 = DSM 16096]|uniref:Methyltransferase domain-containing protein n=1 Tax=Litchfieldella anticariensis (strain DSM 16096 / CECT 5854 / CIP 108499 / LMG 22089 / FP35) TaxID=1121939 RepID=S2KIA5_LITA3|nr:methyltransferase domain-containing protein [Halomonas anticariensis]EPC00073.1 hypothetical protein L861_07865 [Halomonas anticariensis FP35 = DSM 16096]